MHRIVSYCVVEVKRETRNKTQTNWFYYTWVWYKLYRLNLSFFFCNVKKIFNWSNEYRSNDKNVKTCSSPECRTRNENSTYTVIALSSSCKKKNLTLSYIGEISGERKQFQGESTRAKYLFGGVFRWGEFATSLLGEIAISLNITFIMRQSSTSNRRV